MDNLPAYFPPSTLIAPLRFRLAHSIHEMKLSAGVSRWPSEGATSAMRRCRFQKSFLSEGQPANPSYAPLLGVLYEVDKVGHGHSNRPPQWLKWSHGTYQPWGLGSWVFSGRHWNGWLSPVIVRELWPFQMFEVTLVVILTLLLFFTKLFKT